MNWKENWLLYAAFGLFVLLMVMYIWAWAVETCPMEICG